MAAIVCLFKVDRNYNVTLEVELNFPMFHFKLDYSFKYKLSKLNQNQSKYNLIFNAKRVLLNTKYTFCFVKNVTSTTSYKKNSVFTGI